MNRDEDIPIELLSDAGWNRIENAVRDELDDRARAVATPVRPSLPRWAALTLAAALLLQLVVAGLVIMRREPADKPLASARFVSEREASDALFGDVALHLEPSSALVVVEDAAHGSLCVLERGAVRFAVPKRGARPPFVVQAGDARVEVVGTRFRVERVAASAVVETYEGTVRVIARGQTRLVTHGQHWVGATRVQSEPAQASATTQSLAAQPASAGVNANANPLDAGFAARTPDDHRARFEQAAAREPNDPRQALRIYHALARESGPWARNALYAAGRLELELGQRAKAERVLRNYLERFPSGANAADARALLQRLTSMKEKVQP